MRYLLSGGTGTTAPRRFRCLPEAMSAAGHPAAADWDLATGPDRITTSRRAGPLPWWIDAPDVGHELVDAAATAASCLRHGRPWSRSDPIIIDAVVGYFQDGGSFLPLLQAWQVATRFAGHFAAAGELTRTRLTTVILAAHDDSGLDCGASLAAGITGQVTELLRGIGVVVYDDRPASGDLAGLAGLPTAPCRLYRGGQAEGCPAGTHRTLAGAMAAAGHPGFDGWQIIPGDTGQIVLPATAGRGEPGGPARPGWVIRAPGIARLYAEACPDEVCMRRRWSPDSSRVITSVIAAAGSAGPGLPALPARSAARAAARLAAQHATGGLTADGILAVLLGTYSRAGLEPPLQAAGEVAARITGHLAEAGIAVAGAWPASPSRPGPPAAAGPGQLPVASARRPGGRSRGVLAACLDSVFWLLTAPLESLIRAAGRPRRLRAGLRNLIHCWIIPLGIPAAAVITFDSLPWRWPHWLAIALIGGVIRPSVPADRAAPVPGPPWDQL